MEGRERSQWTGGDSKRSPGGSVDQWLQIRFTFDEEKDPGPDSDPH
jgi:hypothetical protein